MMPLQFCPTTGNIILKEGAKVNLLVGSHLSSHKLSLGSLILQSSPEQPRSQISAPHNRQQYSPSNNPPFNFDEAIHIVQRENQEMQEAQKRTESQLNHFVELLQKIANQSPVNPQAQAQPLVLSPLPSQPLPNPKGGINAIQIEMDNDAANLFFKMIRNNPTSASDQVVSTRVGYHSQRGKGINQYFLIILQLDQTN
ncbi:hypothetical protein PIB30_089418 [Stylosanthes scabra]|uniref:Uncharacterized protein n=1 Tax=Stylosanthes scabra TaxID=79078 RepID=A0ABU6QTG0_9FABA|nr:hypothetical protein [Stylosanthes scabra]